MVKEWARALVCCSFHSSVFIYIDNSAKYDGIATLTQPPNTLSFDPTKHGPSLLPSAVAVSGSKNAQFGSDLAVFASIFSDIRGLVQGPHTAVPASPSSSHTPSASKQSPTRPSPSQLTRFLRHCEDDLGILNASVYESPLRRKSYGPDILHKVDNKALEDLGISPGNIICLKDAVIPCYNGPSAKKRRIVRESGVENKKPLVAYEKRWFDTEGNQTGGNRFWGPPMEGGDGVLEPGLQIWYKCEARQDWFPIPREYVTVAEGEDNDFFSSSN
jgi:hypothetical protein